MAQIIRPPEKRTYPSIVYTMLPSFSYPNSQPSFATDLVLTEIGEDHIIPVQSSIIAVDHIKRSWFSNGWKDFQRWIEVESVPKSSESLFRLQEFQTTIWKNRWLSISINFLSIEIPWHTYDFQVANLCWKILIHSTREDSATFILEASCGFYPWKTTSYRDTLSSSPNLSKSGTACLFVWKTFTVVKDIMKKLVSCTVPCHVFISSGRYITKPNNAFWRASPPKLQ